MHPRAAIFSDIASPTMPKVKDEVIPQPNWGPIGKDVFERTYSRAKPNGTKESWEDTVNRVVQGNTKFVDAKFIEPNEADELFNLFYNFKAIPAGRHLWVTGIPGRQFISNCWNSHWWPEFSRHFAFMFERLMEGGGVGSNYSNKYLKQYPAFKSPVELHFVCSPTHKDYAKLKTLLSNDYSHEWTGTTSIADTREGWVSALSKVIDSVFLDEKVTVIFDLSQIRAEGEPIKSFGGTASGPVPLATALRNIAAKLNEFIGKKPTSILCMEIDHEIGSCVIAGNVRRSARMSMKHWKDDDIFDFLTCKNLDKDGVARAHWSTNISVVVDNQFFRKLKERDPLAKKISRLWAKGQLMNGEPGFYNISKASEGEPSEAFTTNPCGEIPFSMPAENCNLGHLNMAAFVNDQSGFLKAARLMTRFLIRATFADFTDPEAKKAIHTNRRIGVGLFGFHTWLVTQGIRFSESHEKPEVRKFLRKAYEVIRKEARDYAFMLRIPEPIKVTTCAPTGTIAKLPGETEGIQSVIAKYFIRRVNFSTLDPIQAAALAEYTKKGYTIEDSAYTPNTKVVSFYVKDPIIDKVIAAGYNEEIVEVASEIDLEDMLAVQAMIQEEFADNAISFTINFDKDKKRVGDLIRALKIFGPRLKGTTMMPTISNRPQMPYEAITKEQYLAAKITEVGQVEADCINGCPVK